ncbi:rhomboid family intramembrane serine protease [Vibrio sp.]|uniref:rhomboid family intramembrane serine protease n=1 Tax=Vibrio sp. TaxID=678 RepID=UPI00311FB2C6
MILKRLPNLTLILAVLTVVTSLVVNYQISGSLFEKIKVADLEPYGGYTYKHLLDLELWRLFVSQLIHVKQIHMVYNVISLLALGSLLERKLGSPRFAFIWMVAGTTGTFISTFTVAEPWNLGTGGSQAILGLAASGIVLLMHGKIQGKFAVTILVLTIVPAFMLDMIYAEHHLPKLGHIASFLMGCWLSRNLPHRLTIKP